MTRILPSVLVQDRAGLRERLRAINGHVRYAHLDVANHTLVPSKTFYAPAAISQLRPRPRLDVHLMTRLTPAAVRQWNRAWVWRITFHPDATANPPAVVDAIHRLGKQAMLAISPHLPLSAIRSLLPRVDGVLIMGVRPGWGGQPLLPQTLRRTRTLRRQFPRLSITFDGGVNAKTIKRVIAAGATDVVIGSALPNVNFSSHLRQLTVLTHG